MCPGNKKSSENPCAEAQIRNCSESQNKKSPPLSKQLAETISQKHDIESHDCRKSYGVLLRQQGKKESQRAPCGVTMSEKQPRCKDQGSGKQFASADDSDHGFGVYGMNQIYGSGGPGRRYGPQQAVGQREYQATVQCMQ